MLRFLYPSIGFLVVSLAYNSSLAQPLSYLKPNTALLQQARKSEQLARQHHDVRQLADAWFQYGNAYEQVGDNRQAEPYFLKALRLLEPNGESSQLTNVELKLSEVEIRQGHLDEAMRYARDALAVAQHLNLSSEIINAYLHIGQTKAFMWTGNPDRTDLDSAFFWYKQAETLAIQTQDTLHIAFADTFLGSLWTEVNFRQAIFYLQRALPLFERLHNDEWRVKTLIHLSTAYRRMGQLVKAGESIRQADKIYREKHVNEHGTQAMLEDRFSQYLAATGHWKEALDHFIKLNELEKQQLLADRNGVLARLNIEYETQKKEYLLQKQSSELSTLRLQQRFTIVTTILLLIVIGLAIFFYQLYRKNQRISRQNEELVKEQNHRVKNNLQVVSSLLRLQAYQLTDEAARQAIEESQLRIQSMAILHQKLYDGIQLALIEINQFIPDLISGVLHTFGQSHVMVQLKLDPLYLSADKATPLGLILNELVTNSCKYAFPDHSSPELYITCQLNGQKLRVNVTDNGPGLKIATFALPIGDLLQEKHTTFGMSLIQTQVAQLNGIAHFEVHDAERSLGTRFNMEFSI